VDLNNTQKQIKTDSNYKSENTITITSCDNMQKYCHKTQCTKDSMEWTQYDNVNVKIDGYKSVT